MPRPLSLQQRMLPSVSLACLAKTGPVHPMTASTQCSSGEVGGGEGGGGGEGEGGGGEGEVEGGGGVGGGGAGGNEGGLGRNGGGGSYTHSPTSGPGPLMTKPPPAKPVVWSRRLAALVVGVFPKPIERSRYSFENGPVSFTETVASRSSWDQA